MRDNCLLTEGARRCEENQQCATCGFNPDVAVKRKAAIRASRKTEPPKAAIMVNLNDVLTAVDELAKSAEKHRNKENLNGKARDLAYWRGRADEAKTIHATLEQMGGDDDV